MSNQKYLKDNLADREGISYLKINSVEIHGEEECSVNKGIFASDHYGLCCGLEINFI